MAVIESLLTCKCKPKWELGKIWEAICYVTRTGCQWHLVPVNYAPWQTVYWYFWKWTLEGVIEIAHQTIRRVLRKLKGKKESVRIGTIDSASVRMSSVIGHDHELLRKIFTDGGYLGELGERLKKSCNWIWKL